MSMSYEAACDKVKNLKAQGIKIEAIAEQLKSDGYISGRTGKHVTPMTVRYMLKQALGEKGATTPKKSKKHDLGSIKVSSPKGDLLDAIEKVLAVPNLSVEHKYEFARSLLLREERSSAAS